MTPPLRRAAPRQVGRGAGGPIAAVGGGAAFRRGSSRRPAAGLAAPLLAALVALALGCGARGAGDAGGPAPDAGPTDAGPPIEVAVFDGTLVSGVGGDPAFQTVDATVDLPAGRFSHVLMTYTLQTRCVPPPGPPGDLCDPWDRFTNVTIDAPGGPIELMRAITPFGGDRVWTEEVTDYQSLLSGTTTLHLTITSYADPSGAASGTQAGFLASLSLSYEAGEPARDVLAILPIFTGELDGTTLPFAATLDVPAGATAGALRVRTSGHGAVMPNCDEFCPRPNVLTVDGTEITAVSPWRYDCESFCSDADADGSCDENPWGLPASVRADRSGWCPSDVVVVRAFDATPFVAAGPHALTYDVVGVLGYWKVGLDLVVYR
ncbi:MAG TPA: peptide-N-glycosidase F-related protein [Myxococcota bacterium]|jgi:hypothetical protein|nr:peptide-N-glycosidase F-related protein [Myxococcota bacterium]